MTNILITGASGFVGRKIVERLSLIKDIELSVLLRNTSSGEGLLQYGVRIYNGDITRPKTLQEPLKGKDVVIHCAALMSNFEMESREKFYEVNVNGTENLLNACDAIRLKQFLHISTAGVLGATGDHPAGESAPYGRRLTAYEWSKAEAESLILEYSKIRKVPFTILRPSQLYGPGMRYGWPETIKTIKSGGMAIPGNGKSRIHLVNIYDLIRVVELVLLNKTAINKIYNVAGPDILQLNEVFDIISRLAMAKPPKRVPYLPVYMASVLLQYLPPILKTDKMSLLTPHRVRFFATNHVYDISKARSELGYNPGVNTRDGFCQLVKWCEEEGFI